MNAALLAITILLFSIVSAVVNPTQQTLDQNDNNVLKFALTLENLDSTFFSTFQQVYSRNAFIAAGYDGTVWDNLDLLRLQELAHVQVLQATLMARTGSMLPVCNYNFSMITSIQTYIGGAKLFENVGTGAYDGSIAAIYNRTLQQAAATIATVEGRHAAFVNQLAGAQLPIPSPVTNKTSPFPAAFDYAFPPMTVAQYIMPFIVNCSYNVTALFPQVYVVVPVAAPSPSQPQNPTQDQVLSNDLAVLNFALTLELLEATFYNRYLGNVFGAAQFTAAGLTVDDYNYFLMVQAHENAHVTFLMQTVIALGGTPVTNCTYNFPGVTSVMAFIQTAQALENTGVSAYDGSANRITTPGYRQAAATIATVEGRHAAFINSLLNATGWFPNAVDTPISPDQIITIASGFLSNCPIPPPVPQVLVITPYSNSSTTATSSTSSTGASTQTSSTSSSTTHGTTGTTHVTSTTSAATSLSAIYAIVLAAIFLLAH